MPNVPCERNGRLAVKATHRFFAVQNRPTDYNHNHNIFVNVTKTVGKTLDGH